MLSRLKALLTPQRLPAVDGLDYSPLATHPHFKTYVTLKPHFPDDGPAAVRSWFGGKPQMPADTPWPKDDAGRPCLFLAQICCADLPPDLWGGAGPIDGWFLFFMAPEALEPHVIHISELGPERHEESGVERTHWEWNTRDDPAIGTPRFRKFPVRPEAQTMPSNLALPKREQPEAPPMRPRTWGQLDVILTWLEEDFRPPSLPSPEQQEIILTRQLASFDGEPADRHARRAEAFERSDAAHMAMLDARAEALELFRPWFSMCFSRDANEPLNDSDWSKFFELANETKRPELKVEVIEPEVAPGIVDAPYCFWWRPFATKAEFEAEIVAVGVFSTKHGFSGCGDFHNMEKTRRRARDGFGKWTDDQEREFQREKRFYDLKKEMLRASNVEYDDALHGMLRLVDAMGDSDQIHLHLIDDFLAKSRSNLQVARWSVGKDSQRQAPVLQKILTCEGPVIPGLTEDGLMPARKTQVIFDRLGPALLEGFWSCEATHETIDAAHIFGETKSLLGRTMGGLPFFGHHLLNIMDLQAYASPAQRATLDDPTNRAVYGDPEKMEPQCLLLNLGSDDPVGWLWGDCYTLTLHMPRADLEAGRFDRVTGFIDNG